MRAELSVPLLVNAYSQGIFPMADEDGEIYWFSPDPRAIILPDQFHAPRTLLQLDRQKKFDVTVNRDLPAVISCCADRPEGSWISSEIREAFIRLHRRGFAHSVEAWREGELAGGLYGVALGGAFFGESMFFRVSNASKLALLHLVRRMRQRGFTLLDIQFKTRHLKQFNCIEVARKEYLARLDEALTLDCRFA